MPQWGVVPVAMSNSLESETGRSERFADALYLPAVELPPKFERLEAFAAGLFGPRGRVRIPLDRYE